MNAHHLPLGIDIGATRVRVAHAVREKDGVRIAGIAVRDLSTGSASSGSIADPEYVATLIEEAVDELGVRQRACICAIAEPDARMRTMRLPKIGHEEKQRAAAFEARRLIDYPMEEATVQIHAFDREQGLHALGVARTSVLQSRVAVLRMARLKAVAVDHESCAFARAFHQYDAVVDVGHQRLSLHAFVKNGTPVTLSAATGGELVTRSIARDLAIDGYTAEKRKRILGTAGAGDSGRTRLTSEIVRLIEAARNRSLDIRTIAFTGNGSRLPRLLADVEHATGAACSVAAGDALKSSGYAEDVVRAAAADWTLAASLATWAVAS